MALNKCYMRERFWRMVVDPCSPVGAIFIQIRSFTKLCCNKAYISMLSSWPKDITSSYDDLTYQFTAMEVDDSGCVCL